MTRQDHKTLLIYAPVPLIRKNGVLYLEGQACNGLRLWAENFAKLLVMMPVEDGEIPDAWVPLDSIGPALDRIEIHPLPTAYRLGRFARTYRPTRSLIRTLIDRADYLSFAIGGLFGDWGAVACIQAHHAGRPYAVWTDRVESQVVRDGARQGSLKHRIRDRLAHRPMAALERHVIRRAKLGLFHGRDTFDFYAPYCQTPVLVHDIHISRDDHIPHGDLARKLADCTGGPIRIVYVGRADAMKGPLDWVKVLARLDAHGVDFQATWLGDGDDMPGMKAQVEKAGLGAKVALPGFTTDRGDVLKALRDAQIFLFCHKTPESPRCLIEALTCATPIVGYSSAFAADLIGTHGGGVLTKLNDVNGLADAVEGLGKDRDRLGDLIARAARDGAGFDDVSVFRHRSEVIRANL